jgi:hypothetical protein
LIKIAELRIAQVAQKDLKMSEQKELFEWSSLEHFVLEKIENCVHEGEA